MCVWTQSYAPHYWHHASLVPLPKKGDLRQCDNWRGTALLDVVGKLCGRLIQNQLRPVVENEVPELQCGFHIGRGCPDAAFCAVQLIEKACEHNCKLFLIFMNLCKAYDLVPRAGLWNAFHEDMVATVRVAGGWSEPIQVRNGLRQGCGMAPVLFNLYFAVGLERFHEFFLAFLPCLESGCMSISTGTCFLAQLVTLGFLMIAFLIWNTQMMACFVNPRGT